MLHSPGIDKRDLSAGLEYNYQEKMWKFIHGKEMKDSCFLLSVHFVHFAAHVFWVHGEGRLSLPGVRLVLFDLTFFKKPILPLMQNILII